MVKLDPVPLLEKVYKKHGYPIFRGGPFDLNLFGIRAGLDTNLFDDAIGCHTLTQTGEVEVYIWPATTDPGFAMLKKPMNRQGCAALVEGLYKGLWGIGKHKDYEALVQIGDAKVVRDNDLNEKLNLQAPTQTGIFGLNCHRSSPVEGRPSKTVDTWSAACQVHATVEGFNEMMSLARKQVKQNPKWTTFSYALFSIQTDPELEAFLYRAK
jgi:hypothetical protein